MSLGLNILLIFVFLVIGSVFSGTELALVSLRGSQIEQMEQEDARGAKVAKIARDPNTFLSTVQIGVTLSGFLSASFGASSIAPYLIPVVESWGVHPGIDILSFHADSWRDQAKVQTHYDRKTHHLIAKSKAGQKIASHRQEILSLCKDEDYAKLYLAALEELTDVEEEEDSGE